MYQIYPRSFADASGDGIGDIPGILQHLDHLAYLGVDVVWLSPVYASPMDDNGYDISNYRDVDPLFGTIEDLEKLIVGLHERGMKLVMDLVVNHTSDEHPWFKESASGPDSAKRDWYWWRPPREGSTPGQAGSEPTNWVSFFSGPTWEYDEASGEYYMHLFSRKQPDLNWENPQVRHAVYDMMRWWLDRGVDGFRMDVINVISKDPALPDSPLLDGEHFGRLGRAVMDGPKVHDYLQEMHEEVFARTDRPLLLVGETPGTTIEEARKYTAPERHEVDMIFQFEHMEVDRGTSKWDVLPFDVRVLRSSLADWQEGLADKGWNSLYWNNHDQPRGVSRFGDDGEHRVRSAKLLATVLHLLRGTPYIYQGEELGMTNYPFSSIEEFEDLESLNYHREAASLGVDEQTILDSLSAMGRDNARTPMQWDASPQAGFTNGQPWLTVNPNYSEINAASQVGDPDSVLEHYRALIRLRHEEPAVAYGDFTLELTEHDQLFAFSRRHEQIELLVVANFAGSPTEIPAAFADRCAAAELILGNLSGSSTVACLQPWEARVYRRTTEG